MRAPYRLSDEVTDETEFLIINFLVIVYLIYLIINFLKMHVMFIGLLQSGHFIHTFCMFLCLCFVC